MFRAVHKRYWRGCLTYIVRNDSDKKEAKCTRYGTEEGCLNYVKSLIERMNFSENQANAGKTKRMTTFLQKSLPEG